MSTTTTPALPPPPPSPEDSAAAVQTVPRTAGEKVTSAIGSRAMAFGNALTGFSGAPQRSFADTSVGKAMDQHYQTRLAEARRNWQDAQTKLQVLNGNVDPQTGQPLSPQQRQDLYNEAQGAWGAYAKVAGVDKETKAQIAQKKNLFDLALTHGIKAAHEIATKLGIAQPGAGGQAPSGGSASSVPPPPSPSAGPQQASADTPAGATTNAAVPPPPAAPAAPAAGVGAGAGAGYDPGMNADAGRVRQQLADRRQIALDQAKADIQTKAKIEEEKAKTPPSKSTPASDAYFSLLDQVDPKTGEKYTAQEALRIVTQASQKAGRPTPFEEYMSDPTHYSQFEKEMADAKAKQTPGKGASIGAVYGIYRMLEMGYKQNPEILPVVAALAPQVFKSAGMEIPPALAAALGKVPLDQPLSPTTGEPIGTSMPGAPTAGTRNQAQTAARAITELPNVRKEVEDLKEYLGPISGRKNVAFLLGKVGSTGDDATDQKLSKLRTDLKFMLSAAARFHLNSVRAFQDFEAAANAGKDSSAALLGALDSVGEWAKTAEKQQKGFGERETGVTPPPTGGTKGDPLGIR